MGNAAGEEVDGSMGGGEGVGDAGRVMTYCMTIYIERIFAQQYY